MRLVLALLCVAGPAFASPVSSEGGSENPAASGRAGSSGPTQTGVSAQLTSTPGTPPGARTGSTTPNPYGSATTQIQRNLTPGYSTLQRPNDSNTTPEGLLATIREFYGNTPSSLGSGFAGSILNGATAAQRFLAGGRDSPTAPPAGDGPAGLIGNSIGRASAQQNFNPFAPGSQPPVITPPMIRRITDNAPDDPVINTFAAGYSAGLGDYGGAMDYFQRVVDLGVEEPAVLTAYGEAALNAGQRELARSLARRALELEPENRPADALLRLADKRVETAGLSEKLKGLLPGAKEKPAAPARLAAVGPAPAAAPAAPGAIKAAALAREARQALSLKDPGRARELAGRALAEDPGNPLARVLRAFAHNQEGRGQEALADAQAALARAPGSSGALLMRAWAYNLLKRHAEALADARAVLSRRGDQRMARYLEGAALAGLGRWEEARASLTRAAAGRADLERALSDALSSADPDALLALLDGSFWGPAGREPRAARRSPAPAAAGLWTGAAAGAGAGLLLAWGLRRRPKAPGRRLDRAMPSQYEILGEIGRGGMGVVYEAVDRALARRVALKRMSPELAASPLERSRFLEEARTVARLKHPNIVEIYSILDRDGEIYLVFEHVAGKPVSSLLADCGRLAWSEARRVAVSACAAVEYAHRNGIIHRDIKPANIMVTEADEIKVMDFGVARLAPETGATGTRTVSGTPAYMAPEQEQGAPRKESDVFALGVCLYEMLCGELPFEGRGAGMLMNKLRGSFVPLSRRASGFPEGLEPLLARALAPDPLGRRSAADLGRALESL